MFNKSLSILLRKSRLLLVAIYFFAPTQLFAWSGFDYETGSYIEIESGNLVRTGNEIEFYDYATGSYHYGVVESMRSYGSSVEVEVFDYETGTYRYFEME
jgi:hypothetical protein